MAGRMFRNAQAANQLVINLLKLCHNNYEWLHKCIPVYGGFDAEYSPMIQLTQFLLGRENPIIIRFALFGILLISSACAEKIPTPLTAEERATYTVDKVVVEFPDTASIRWGAGEDLVLDDAGLASAVDEEKEAYLNTREGQVALRKKWRARWKRR